MSSDLQGMRMASDMLGKEGVGQKMKTERGVAAARKNIWCYLTPPDQLLGVCTVMVGTEKTRCDQTELL